MQTKAEEYRERAKWCEQEAAATADPEIKKELTEIARKWRAMVEKLERQRVS